MLDAVLEALIIGLAVQAALVLIERLGGWVLRPLRS